MKIAYVVLNLLFVCATAAGGELPWVPPRFEHARTVHVFVTNFMPPETLGIYNVRFRVIWIRPGEGVETLAHEVGHAAWDLDLTQKEKIAWCGIHAAELTKIAHRHRAARAVENYPRDCWHSFAEGFGQYFEDPALMRRSELNVYLFFRHLARTEPPK
jgi:hypothetical protein